MFTVRRSIRLAATVLTLGMAATSLAPAVSSAQPNQGGGTGNGDYCQSMLERIARYHQIASDPSQPQSVRDFYAARAKSTLLRAQLAGCDYKAARTRAEVVSPGTLTGATARRARVQRRAFDRLGPTHRSNRSAKRTASTGGTHGSRTPARVAQLKAHPSGNPSQDQYCSDVADLIGEADAEGDRALLNGDTAGAAAWYELADSFIDQATQNGCRFVFLKHGMRLPAAQQVIATRR